MDSYGPELYNLSCYWKKKKPFFFFSSVALYMYNITRKKKERGRWNIKIEGKKGLRNSKARVPKKAWKFGHRGRRSWKFQKEIRLKLNIMYLGIIAEAYRTNKDVRTVFHREDIQNISANTNPCSNIKLAPEQWRHIVFLF